MKTINLNIQKNEVAFARINRKYKPNKALIANIKEIGLLTKLTLVETKLMLDAGFELYAPISDEKVTFDNYASYPYTVIDGQHRYLSIVEINQSCEEKDKLIETVSAECYTSLDEFPNGDINSLIIALNNTSRSWSNSDFIKNKKQITPSNPLLKAISLLDDCKFSITTISLCLAKVRKVIHKDTISKYVPGNAPLLDDIDYKKGIEILTTLLYAGFELKYLRSRYIWEFIASTNNDANHYLSILYAMGKSGDQKYLKEVENYKDDVNSIAQYCKKYSKTHEVTNLTLDFSDEKYRDNCELLAEVAEKGKVALETNTNVPSDNLEVEFEDANEVAQSIQNSDEEREQKEETHQTNNVQYSTPQISLDDLMPPSPIIIGNKVVYSRAYSPNESNCA